MNQRALFIVLLVCATGWVGLNAIPTVDAEISASSPVGESTISTIGAAADVAAVAPGLAVPDLACSYPDNCTPTTPPSTDGTSDGSDFPDCAVALANRVVTIADEFESVVAVQGGVTTSACGDAPVLVMERESIANGSVTSVTSFAPDGVAVGSLVSEMVRAQCLYNNDLGGYYLDGDDLSVQFIVSGVVDSAGVFHADPLTVTYELTSGDCDRALFVSDCRISFTTGPAMLAPEHDPAEGWVIRASVDVHLAGCEHVQDATIVGRVTSSNSLDFSNETFITDGATHTSYRAFAMQECFPDFSQPQVVYRIGTEFPVEIAMTGVAGPHGGFFSSPLNVIVGLDEQDCEAGRP